MSSHPVKLSAPGPPTQPSTPFAAPELIRAGAPAQLVGSAPAPEVAPALPRHDIVALPAP